MIQVCEVNNKGVVEGGVREKTGTEVSTIGLTMLKTLAAGLLAAR